MSVKETAAVNQYTADLIACENNLHDLCQFVNSLPEPLDGELPNADYRAVQRIGKLREAIAAATKLADDFWK